MLEKVWAIINVNYDFLIIKTQDEFVMLFYFIKQYTIRSSKFCKKLSTKSLIGKHEKLYE